MQGVLEQLSKKLESVDTQLQIMASPPTTTTDTGSDSVQASTEQGRSTHEMNINYLRSLSVNEASSLIVPLIAAYLTITRNGACFTCPTPSC